MNDDPAAWLAEARPLRDALALDDPRRARAQALIEEAEGATGERWPCRYPSRMSWGRERGWLRVVDPHTGRTLDVPADQCPDSWRRVATATTQAARAQRMTGPNLRDRQAQP